MKVELVKIKFNDGDVCYKYKPIEYCCEKFRLNPVIVFDTQEELYNGYCEKCEVNERSRLPIDENSECMSCSIRAEYIYNESLIPQFFIYSSEEVKQWEDSWLKEDYYKVDFCPHCGEKIEISIVDEIDANEKYRELTFERNELNEKRRKTGEKYRCLVRYLLKIAMTYLQRIHQV